MSVSFSKTATTASTPSIAIDAARQEPDAVQQQRRACQDYAGVSSLNISYLQPQRRPPDPAACLPATHGGVDTWSRQLEAILG